jgi:exodeoxyribonuclease VII large subunit
VARAIRACAIPVVVGVGHESDFTIADFAADHRAPTPTAAAELVSPSRAEMLARLAEDLRCLSREMRRRLEYAMQKLDACTRRLVHPAERLRSHGNHVTQLGARLAFAFGHRVHRCDAHLQRLQAALASLDPTGVLARGYSITYDADGKVLRDAAHAAKGTKVRTTLARGSLESEVTAVQKPRERG